MEARVLAEMETAAPAMDSAPRNRTARGLSHEVRQVAREAASRHGMTPGEFLSKAILAYAEQLRISGANGGATAPADALRRHEARIVVLEQRIRALETSAKLEGMRSRRLLQNLVERPWMRIRDY